MIVKPCCHPGCRKWAKPHTSRCEDHAVETRVGDQARAARIRNSSQWQKVRALHRSKQPLCTDPFREHSGPVVADSVHHIEGVATHPELAFTPSNLASLCSECHARVEALERAGQSTQHLFPTSHE
jgi:5-methylcytosine-specific restriction endonuclease McrA